MSMDYNDIWEYGVESECCGAQVYLNGICAKCNDHCTTITEYALWSKQKGYSKKTKEKIK